MEFIGDIFRMFDVFAPPVDRQITFKGQRRVSSICGGFCSLMAVGFIIWMFAVEMQNLSADQVYSESSTVVSTVGKTVATPIDSANTILAFQNSLSNDWMIGMFYQVTSSESGALTYTPTNARSCWDLYGDNPAIMNLLAVPDPQDQPYLCLDSEATPSIIPHQQGFNQTYILEMTDCQDAAGYYFSRTGHSETFPYTAYNITDPDNECKSSTDVFASGQLISASSTVKVISQVFDWKKYKDGSDHPFDYQLSLTTEQSFIEDVFSSIDVQMQQNDIFIGEDRVMNSNTKENFMREKHTSFRTKNTNFSFVNNRGSGSVGNSIVFNTYSLNLMSFKGKTVIDLYLTFPIAVAQLGGFIIGWYIITWLLLLSWNYFNTNMQIMGTLTTFSMVETGSAPSPQVEAQSIIKNRGVFEYNWFTYIFQCCCSREKAILFNSARDKKDAELDIINMVDNARKANFLKKLQRTPDKVDLIKYSSDYRVETPLAGMLEGLPEDRRSLNLAESLDKDAHTLDRLLVMKILGRARAPVQQQAVANNNLLHGQNAPQ